jgi:hypothetical protein
MISADIKNNLSADTTNIFYSVMCMRRCGTRAANCPGRHGWSRVTSCAICTSPSTGGRGPAPRVSSRGAPASHRFFIWPGMDVNAVLIPSRRARRTARRLVRARRGFLAAPRNADMCAAGWPASYTDQRSFCAATLHRFVTLSSSTWTDLSKEQNLVRVKCRTTDQSVT